jgi:hypothetical protein
MVSVLLVADQLKVLVLVLQPRVNEVHETLGPPLRLFAMSVVRLLPALARQIIH